MNKVYLLIGGNLGDRQSNLEQACKCVERQVGQIIQRSALYETAAWGVTDQPAFLNQVLVVETGKSAEDILQTILSIEETMGRKRVEKMGPRIIDIDILFYNNDVIELPDLKVPHPEIANRRFVLQPLDEIAPQLIHPQLQITIKELLHECTDPLEVKLYEAR